MKHKKLSLVLSVLIVLLSFPGCQSLEEAVASAIFATPEITPEPTPEPVRTPEPVPFETTMKGLHNDLYGVENIAYSAVTRPVNGHFWLQRNGSDTSQLTAFGLDGSFCFTTENLVCMVTDFNEDGQTLVTLGQGDYSRRGDGAYRIERLDRTTDLILDDSGRVLYSTAWQKEWSEEILCHGEGRFISLRHRQKEGEEEWVLGALDANGRELVPFLPFEEIPGSDQTRPNQLTKSFPLYSTALTGRADPSYLGDGWYALPGSYASLLYRPETSELRRFIVQRVLTRIDNGCFLGLQDGQICVCDLDKQSTRPLKNYTESEFSGAYWIDGCVLVDTRGNAVLDLSADYEIVRPTIREDLLAVMDVNQNWYLLDFSGNRVKQYVPPVLKPSAKESMEDLENKYRLENAIWISETWIAYMGPHFNGHFSVAAWKDLG